MLDERFKRSKYNPAVAEKIIERMSSERHQIASKFRSEGRGEAANINGQKESDVANIQSSATRKALKIEGEADAEAARIYSEAYNSPEAQSLYSFVRRLEVARAAFARDTTAVISTETDFGNLLKGIGERRQPRHASAPTLTRAVKSGPATAGSQADCLTSRRLCPVISAGFGKPSRKSSVGAISARMPLSSRKFFASAAT